MGAVRAVVRSGRLVVDEPTDLADGQVVELIPIAEVLVAGGDTLDSIERAALHRAIDEGIDDFERGDVMDAFELAERMNRRHEAPDRQAGSGTGRARG